MARVPGPDPMGFLQQNDGVHEKRPPRALDHGRRNTATFPVRRGGRSDGRTPSPVHVPLRRAK
jgi:hypothetical protein